MPRIQMIANAAASAFPHADRVTEASDAGTDPGAVAATACDAAYAELAPNGWADPDALTPAEREAAALLCAAWVLARRADQHVQAEGALETAVGEG